MTPAVSNVNIFNYLFCSCGLVVESDHLDARRPHGDGGGVRGVYTHAGGVTSDKTP